MSTYTLEAVLGTTRRKKTIHADSQMDATFQAVSHIMDAAYKDQSGPWANGHIILSDSEGLAIHTMDASK